MGGRRTLAPLLFLPRLLLRSALLCLSLWLGLLFRRLFDRLFGRLLRRRTRSRRFRSSRRSAFRLLLANDQLLFLSLDDFACTQLVVFFQPRQLVVILKIVFLEIHSILPWGILPARVWGLRDSLSTFRGGNAVRPEFRNSRSNASPLLSHFARRCQAFCKNRGKMTARALQ